MLQIQIIKLHQNLKTQQNCLLLWSRQDTWPLLGSRSFLYVLSFHCVSQDTHAWRKHNNSFFLENGTSWLKVKTGWNDHTKQIQVFRLMCFFLRSFLCWCNILVYRFFSSAGRLLNSTLWESSSLCRKL